LADENGSINKPSSDKVGGNRTSAQAIIQNSCALGFEREVVGENLTLSAVLLRKKYALLAKGEYFSAR